ncbi:regulator of chromosome condensation 1 [Oratosquilla oratoria]|uniref:regulator of chromosome condensation 1 n=1 Tax=Oratosquilla oratoria TaxID=337810 RepID=UPI003F763ECD
MVRARTPKVAKENGEVTKASQMRKRKSTAGKAADLPKKIKVAIPVLEVRGVPLTVGTGDIGQLGLGPNVEERTRPALVPDLEDVVAVAAGGLHSVSLDKNGKVYTWGCNDEGALGRKTTCEEDNFVPAVVPLDSKVVRVSAGDCHTAALTEDGKVFAWGCFRDNSGLLGFLEKEEIQHTPKQILEDIPVIEIASGNNHLACLTHDGHIYTSGCGESGQLGRIAEVFATRNSRHRKGVEILLTPQPIKVFKSRKLVLFDHVWAGGYTTFARAKDSGDVYGFGLNNYCQLGDDDTNTKFQPHLLKEFRGRKWEFFSSGQHHSAAVDSEGRVHVMGRCEYGRLGLGEGSKDAISPTMVPKLIDKTVTHVSAGECVTLAVTNDGEAYGFGMGTNNQLAQGDEEDRWDPTLIGGKQLQDRKVVAACAGGQHTILLAVPK